MPVRRNAFIQILLMLHHEIAMSMPHSTLRQFANTSMRRGFRAAVANPPGEATESGRDLGMRLSLDLRLYQQVAGGIGGGDLSSEQQNRRGRLLNDGWSCDFRSCKQSLAVIDRQK